MNSDFLRREWGAVSFLVVTALGIIAVPIGLSLNRHTVPPAPAQLVQPCLTPLPQVTPSAAPSPTTILVACPSPSPSAAPAASPSAAPSPAASPTPAQSPSPAGSPSP